MQYVDGGNPENYGVQFSVGDEYHCYWDWNDDLTRKMDLNEYTNDNIINTYSLTKDNNAILRARDYAVVVGGEGTEGRLLVIDEVRDILNGDREDLKNIITGSYNPIGQMYYWIATVRESDGNNICLYAWVVAQPLEVRADSTPFGVRPILEVPKSQMLSVSLS